MGQVVVLSDQQPMAQFSNGLVNAIVAEQPYVEPPLFVFNFIDRN